MPGICHAKQLYGTMGEAIPGLSAWPFQARSILEKHRVGSRRIMLVSACTDMESLQSCCVILGLKFLRIHSPCKEIISFR